MAGENINLKQTLREVVGETIETPKTSDKQATEGVSQSQSGETKSGETPEYVAGVNISDVPEQDRPRIKALLEEKAKLLEKGYQPKFQEVAALKKSLEWLSSKGVTAEKAEKIILSSIEAEQNPKGATAEQKKDKRTLDKLMEESPYEQRHALEQMRTIVKEESGSDKVEALEKRLAQAEKVLGYYQSKDLQLGETQIRSELEALKDKFGKDVIEKYQDNVLGEWRKFPQSKAKDILKYVVPDEEYEQALLSGRTKQSRTKEKAEAVTSAGGGVTSSADTIDTSGKWKDFLHRLPKK